MAKKNFDSIGSTVLENAAKAAEAKDRPPKKAGRPKLDYKTSRINLVLPEDLNEYVRSMAALKGIHISQFIVSELYGSMDKNLDLFKQVQKMKAEFKPVE